METDAELKVELQRRFQKAVKDFIRQHQLPLTAREFTDASADAYHQWRRNPH